jgi:hypothetical protein
MITPIQFVQIQKYLKEGQPFEIERNGVRPSSVSKISFYSRIQDQIDAAFHKQRLGVIADIFANHLQRLPRHKPKETIDNNIIKTTKSLLRQFKKIEDPRISRCQRELLAYSLGISSELFDQKANLGFEEFASNPPLNRYLAAYGHEVKVSKSGEIHLQKGDKYVRWSILKEKVVIPERDPVTNQPWLYGPKGIQNKNMFEWTKLKPYKWEDPSQWDGKLLFVLCCCCGPDYPNFIGDHTWIEFWLSNGAKFSVGLYRGYKHKPGQNTQSPLRIQKGYLMQPDVSRFWPDTKIHEIPFEITQKEFNAMKQRIEEDKKDENLTFQLIGNNCTEYAKKIAKIAEIEIPTEKPFWELLSKRYIPRPLVQTIKTISSKLPGQVTTLSAGITNFALSLPLLAFGADKVDPKLKDTGCQPHLKSWADCFEPKKFMVNHPHTLGNETREFIETTRNKEENQLKEILPDKKTSNHSSTL